MKASDIVNVTDEWKVLCMDDDVKSILRNQRVDHFWRQIFSLQTSAGEARYPYLTNVIKSGLVLPHGNADVERALSVNNSLVTTERSQLSEKVIIGLRSTQDMVKFCDPQLNRPQKLPLTKKTIAAARCAHSEYLNRLEMYRKNQEEEKRRKEMKKVESEKMESLRKQMKKQKQVLTRRKTSSLPKRTKYLFHYQQLNNCLRKATKN